MIPCPVCKHAMNSAGMTRIGVVWLWCPYCGTMKDDLAGASEINVPQFIKIISRPREKTDETEPVCDVCGLPAGLQEIKGKYICRECIRLTTPH